MSALVFEQRALQRSVRMRVASTSSAGRCRLSMRPAPLHQRCKVLLSTSVSQHVVETATKAADKPKGPITELNKDTFYSYLDEAKDTLVIVDFYTDWCGPCKMIYPELEKLAVSYEGRVLFTKFNCNKENKEVGSKLGIRVAPTFHLYRNSQKVAEMTGAKVDKLKSLIEQNL